MRRHDAMPFRQPGLSYCHATTFDAMSSCVRQFFHINLMCLFIIIVIICQTVTRRPSYYNYI